MIALISSSKLKINKLILCSLSPYFKEDIPSLKNWWKNYVGKKRIADLKNYSFNEIAKPVKCKTIILFGGKEPKILIKRAKNAHKILKKSKLIIVKGAKHDIGQKEYLKTLGEVISKL